MLSQRYDPLTTEPRLRDRGQEQGTYHFDRDAGAPVYESGSLAAPLQFYVIIRGRDHRPQTTEHDLTQTGGDSAAQSLTQRVTEMLTHH